MTQPGEGTNQSTTSVARTEALTYPSGRLRRIAVAATAAVLAMAVPGETASAQTEPILPPDIEAGLEEGTNLSIGENLALSGLASETEEKIANGQPIDVWSGVLEVSDSNGDVLGQVYNPLIGKINNLDGSESDAIGVIGYGEDGKPRVSFKKLNPIYGAAARVKPDQGDGTAYQEFHRFISEEELDSTLVAAGMFDVGENSVTVPSDIRDTADTLSYGRPGEGQLSWSAFAEPAEGDEGANFRPIGLIVREDDREYIDYELELTAYNAQREIEKKVGSQLVEQIANGQALDIWAGAFVVERYNKYDERAATEVVENPIYQTMPNGDIALVTLRYDQYGNTIPDFFVMDRLVSQVDNVMSAEDIESGGFAQTAMASYYIFDRPGQDSSKNPYRIPKDSRAVIAIGNTGPVDRDTGQELARRVQGFSDWNSAVDFINQRKADAQQPPKPPQLPDPNAPPSVL